MTEPDREVFRGYAKFYDRLYADKDYVAECRFLERVFAKNGVTHGASVLDLGCGTGGHLIPMARSGYDVTGVDRSREMISIAEAKTLSEGLTPSLLVADVRDLALGRTFDAVVAMFAVVGYQLSNRDLASMFSVARDHLDVGGLFVFDAWFGPAVLTEKPEVKRKMIPLDDGETLVRVATPTLDVIAQTVRVDYTLEREGAGGSVHEVAESHTVRFLFAQEVAYFLEVAGFEVSGLMPFMREGEVPTSQDWNVTWVARAV
jgi:SAM-dependent methyltransferase